MLFAPYLYTTVYFTTFYDSVFQLKIFTTVYFNENFLLLILFEKFYRQFLFLEKDKSWIFTICFSLISLNFRDIMRNIVKPFSVNFSTASNSKLTSQTSCQPWLNIPSTLLFSPGLDGERIWIHAFPVGSGSWFLHWASSNISMGEKLAGHFKKPQKLN